MDAATQNAVDARLLKEKNEEVAEVLTILGAGEKESLKDAAIRRMWQAMPELMRAREKGDAR